MPTARLIVRLPPRAQGDDLAALAVSYALQGADELSLEGGPATSAAHASTCKRVASVRANVSVALLVHGGVRHLDDVHALLDAGADRVAVGIAALQNPLLLGQMASHHGAHRTVLTIDAYAQQGAWSVLGADSQASALQAHTWAKQGEAAGAGEVLLCAVDRSGLPQGYDLGLLRAVSTSVAVPVVASGAATALEAVCDAFGAGADAVLTAPSVAGAGPTLAGIRASMLHAGLWVRPHAEP